MINSINSNTMNLSTLRPEASVAPNPQPQAEDSTKGTQDSFESQKPDLTGYSRDVKELVARAAHDHNVSEAEIKVITGTSGDDTITVSRGKNLGDVVIDINGKKTSFGNEVKAFVVDGGKGNDNITIDRDVWSTMYLTGGEGNDTIKGGQCGSIIIDNYGANHVTGSANNDIIVCGGYDLDPNSATSTAPQGPKTAGGLTINGSIIFGMGGNDYIQGGKANDYIDLGDSPNATYGSSAAYGMGGNDYITAGTGNHYLSGGDGNDVIQATNGKNIIAGGHGDDTIQGGSDHDVIIDTEGHNTITDGVKGYGKANQIITNSESNVAPSPNDEVSTAQAVNLPNNIKLGGENIGAVSVTSSPGTLEFHEQNGRLAFQERVIEDLETLATLPSGQAYFAHIAPTGKEVNIQQTLGGNSCQHFDGSTLDVNLKPGSGSNAVVNYNTTKVTSGGLAIWSDRPPVVGLYHEMCHSYNSAIGNLDTRKITFDYHTAPGCEFQAVGIKSPEVQLNPKGISENDLRAELSLINRDHY